MLSPAKLVTLGQLREALLRADKALDAYDDEARPATCGCRLLALARCLRLLLAAWLAAWCSCACCCLLGALVWSVCLLLNSIVGRAWLAASLAGFS
jgi:hypothetical protein